MGGPAGGPVIVAWLTGGAAAHGPPAAVTGAPDADPRIVSLTEGIAAQEESGWRYVCPDLWGGLPLGPTLSGDGEGGGWIAGADGRYTVSSGGIVAAAGVPEFAISSILGWGEDLALTVDPVGRGVWRISTGAVLWTTDLPLTGVAASPDGFLAVGPIEGDLWRYAVAGQTVDAAIIGPADSSNPVIRIAAGTEWIVDRTTTSAALSRIDGTGLVAVGPVATEVLGPVAGVAGVWAAFDGVLHEIDGDVVTPIPTGGDVSCLAATWLCVDGVLHTLAPDGTVGGAIVGPSDVSGPRWSAVAMDRWVACYADWRTWAQDVGIDPGPPPEDTGTDTGVVSVPEPDPTADLVLEERGCGCGTPAPLGASWVLGGAWLLGRRRSVHHADPRTTAGAARPGR